MKTLKKYSNETLCEDINLKNTYSNILESQSLKKIIISIGVKETILTANKILYPLLILELISGQKPCQTKARKSIANFKLREGKVIGCKVSLRKEKMYAFLEKFIHVILPQLTETSTLKYNNKKNNNSITLGIKDCSIFPELENQYDLLTEIYGLNINFVSSSKIQSKDNLFFSGFKIPFKRKGE